MDLTAFLNSIHIDPATILLAIFALGGLWRQFTATQKWTQDHEKWHREYIKGHDAGDADRDKTQQVAVQNLVELKEMSRQHEKRIDRLEGHVDRGRMSFPDAWRKLRELEGGYSNHPDDAGGATHFGVTEKVARASGYAGPMEDLPVQKAMEIARRQYWDLLLLDYVDELSPAVAFEVLDTGYNMGPATAARFLQRSLNVLNRQQKDYPDIAVDGKIGPKTVAALSAFLAYRGVQGHRVLLRALNCLQGARYIELAEVNAKNESFIFGWLLNRVEIV